MKTAMILLWAGVLGLNLALWFYGLVKDADDADLTKLQIWLCTSIIVLYIITT